MGLFDDLPDAKFNLFDDLPEATPGVPSDPAMSGALGSVLAPSIPTMQQNQIAPLFADIPSDASLPLNAPISAQPTGAPIPDVTDDARAARGFGRTAYLNGLVTAPQLPTGAGAGQVMRPSGISDGTDGQQVSAIPEAIAAAQAEYEKKSLAEVTGERLYSGALGVDAGLTAIEAANAAEELAILDAAEALDPNDTQGLADLAGRSGRLSLAMVSDPAIRQQTRDFLTRRQEGAAASADAQSRKQSEVPRSPISDAFAKELNENGMTDLAWEMFKSDPMGIVGQVATESAPNAIATVLGGLVNPALAGVAGYGLERGASLNETAQGNLLTLLDDPEARAKVEEYAAQRGIPIAALDTLTMGLSSAMARKPIGNLASQLFVEPPAEGAGEALAQLNSEGRVSRIGDVAQETLGGTGSAIVQAGATSGKEAIRALVRGKDGQPPKIGDADEPPQQPEPPAAMGPSNSRGMPEPDGRDGPRAGGLPELQRPEGQDPVESLPATDGSGERKADLNAEANDEAEPTPAPEAPAPNPERRATVYTPDNEPVEVEYQVVEVDSVLTSDQDGYDQSAQPRNRADNVNSEIQIESIANAPNFARLNRAPETDRGAPLVGADGLAESGNGRTIGLRRAYERGTAEEYRAALEAEYPEAVGMKNPMVIARRITEGMDRQDLAYRSNVSATQAMSAAESAQAEARMLDKDVLDLYTSGPITNAANRGMVMAFIKRLPKSQQNTLTTKDGGLSTEGMRRIQQAMFFKAYDDAGLLDRMAESVDNDMQGITSVLTDLAPQIARMRDEMQRGQIAEDGDFVPALVEALGQVSNMRSRGQNLADFKSQTDAFADPISEDVSIIMDALFNPAGTRLASKKAIADFLEFAIEGASAQDTSVETMPGIEPVPPKQAEEILQNAKRRTETDQEQTSFLDRAPQSGKSTQKVRSEKRRTADGRGSKTDGNAGPKGQVKDAARLSSKPGGNLSPTFMEFAYTNRLSVYNHAFTAAGMDPDKARQMPVEDQIAIARKAVMETFGIEVILPKIKFQKKNLAGRKVTGEKESLASRKALDQILNAYRQLQMLSHVMGMPEKAMGLPIDGKAFQLSLVKGSLLRGALGMFSWGGGKRVITIADMANSFSHEWGHALDHYLSVMADRKAMKGMLSREMADTGVVPPFSPKRALTDAFAHIMWSMMGKASGAGEVIIRLQVESAQLGTDGKPTPKAMRARKILTDIRKGKTPPREYWSDYFKTSKAFDEMTQSDGYFTDPAEMFARAFEAYIAHTVGQISDQPQAFLSKGDFGGTTDARLNLTFPKEVDMAQFVLAMGNLQHAMSRINLHGKDAPARAPNTHDIMDLSEVIRSPEGTGMQNLTARERAEWQRTLEAMKNAPASLKDMSKSAVERIGTFYSQAIRTTAATMYAIADRQPTPEARTAFTNIAKVVGKRPGSGQYQGDVWEQKVRSRVARYVNRLDKAIQEAGSGLIKGFKGLSQQDMRDVNALLRGDKVKVRPEIDRLVTVMRNILDKIWYDLDSAGIEMSYESSYLPHRYDPQKASKEPDKFRAQAAKVYQLMFDREIRDNDDDASQIKDINAIIRGLLGNKKAVASGDVINDPRLTEDDVALVEQWRKERKRLKDLQRRQSKSDDPNKYEDRIFEASEAVENLKAEILDILGDKWSALSADRWLTKIRTGNLADFGSIGPTASFLKGRKLPREAASYMREFMEENPVEMLTGYILDAVRRSEYAAAFGANNEELEAMLMAAEGASREDVEMMKAAVAASTGRVGSVMHGVASAYTTMFSLGTIALLDKASLSSLAEPISIGLRSGQVRDSFHAVAQNIVTLVRLKRHRELKDLARTIGLIMPYAQDTLMQNRMGMDVLTNAKTLQTVVSRFFILNMLTPLTHYQRAAMLPVANAILLRHLREDVTGKKSINSKIRDKIDGEEGGFSNGELNELGIAKDERKDLLEWMESVGGMPSPDDLVGPSGEFSRAGELWSRATVRLSTESIQDTLKSDRTMAANDPNLAAMYGIMSFADAFTRNAIWRSMERGLKDGDSRKAKTAKVAANVALALPAAITLYVGQLLPGILREAMTNPDELEEKIESGEVIEWMAKRTFDRTGFTGRMGPLINAATGLRYQTDMTSLFAGPYPAYLLGNFQRTLSAAFGRNSENTNTAEFNAVEGIYRNMVRIPATALVAGTFPAGPLSANIGRAAIYFLGRRDTEDGFAEALVGEKGAKHVGDPPWWELGD